MVHSEAFNNLTAPRGDLLGSNVGCTPVAITSTQNLTKTYINIRYNETCLNQTMSKQKSCIN